jgi:N,N'-diacetyllegionaminate synthase
MRIEKKYIGKGEPVFIIAEAGVNHNGDEKIAFKMVEEAAKAGADAIKFQTFITKEVVSLETPLAEHHISNVFDVNSHFELIKKLELPLEMFSKLKDYAHKLGLIFISTPYDIISARYLASINVPAVKIASAEVKNTPLVEAVIETKIPVILSTGMNNLEDISRVVGEILDNKIQAGILKCTSNYPADYDNVNLRGIRTLKKKFSGCVIGFSDHTKGYEVSCAAAAIGAKIIEKHFTLDKNMWGPDHRASVNVKELHLFVSAIRNVEKSFGSKAVNILPSEKSQKETMEKSIYSRRDISKGKVVSMDDLMFLRPSGGMPPSDYKEIIKKKCKVDIKAGEKIKREYFI